MNAPCTLGVTSESVSFQNQIEIAFISIVTFFSSRLCITPVIISRLGNTGDLTQFTDLEDVVIPNGGLADDGKFHFWRSLDSHN